MNRRAGLLLACALVAGAAGCASGNDEANTTNSAAPGVISEATAPTVVDSPDAPASTGGGDSTSVESVAGTEAPDTTAPEGAGSVVTADPEGSTPPSAAPEEGGGPLTVEQLLGLGRPIVLAHAAGEDQFPHSSSYGYAQSVAAGVDMIDLDVQLTGDGVLVVHHDDTTGRTADHDLVVGASTFEQLHALDNAYWFTADCVCTDAPPEAYVYRGIRTGAVLPPAGAAPEDFAIARFRDIAERFPDLPVNIEIKGEGAPAIAAARQLAIELTELDLVDNAVVASFDDTVVTAFHELAPTVEISPGLGASSAWVLDGTPLPYGMRILQLPPRFGEIEVLSVEMMERAHAAGYLVWVWPNDRSLENAASYRDLLERGMHGLNINVPELGVEAVEAFTATTAPNTPTTAMDGPTSTTG